MGSHRMHWDAHLGQSSRPMQNNSHRARFISPPGPAPPVAFTAKALAPLFRAVSVVFSETPGNRRPLLCHDSCTSHPHMSPNPSITGRGR
jgi:hypothetical protein